MTRVRALIAGLFLAIAAAGPLTSYLLATREARQLDRLRQDQIKRSLAYEHRRDITDCRSRNQIRDGIVSYIELLTAGAANMAQGVIASSTATADEKRRARAELDGLPGFAIQAHVAFAIERCPAP